MLINGCDNINGSCIYRQCAQYYIDAIVPRINKTIYSVDAQTDEILLVSPNAQHTATELYAQLISDYLIHGIAYAKYELGNRGALEALYAMDYNDVAQQCDMWGDVTALYYRGIGYDRNYIIIRNVNMPDGWRGCDPQLPRNIDIISRAVQQSYNNAVPPLLVEVQDHVAGLRDNAADNQSVLRDRYYAGGANGLWFINSLAMSVKQLSPTDISRLTLPEVYRMLCQCLCRVTLLPSYLFGLSEYNSTAYEMWESVHAQSVARAITSAFVAQLGTAPDINVTYHLPYAENNRVDAINHLMLNASIGKDEHRKLYGIEER